MDRRSPIPLYFQLAESLREEIRQRAAGPGPLELPSEHELTEKHRVSRATVRQALDMLEQEGLLYRAKGRGTFIARRRDSQELTRLISFTEDMERRGWKPSSRLLSVQRIPSCEPFSKALGIADGEPVFEIARVRLANAEPVSLQWSYVSASRCPELDREDLGTSIVRILEDRWGLRMHEASETIRARLATAGEAELLGIGAGDPVLALERVTYTQDGEPIEYLRAAWRGDRYDFTVSLSRSQRGA